LFISTSRRPKLAADARRRCIDRRLIRHVNLDGVSPLADFLDGSFALRKIACADQHGQSLSGEILGDLKADALIGPRHECNAIICHAVILSSLVMSAGIR
jgi:hypothetical protein